jgi:hypothetical protein
MNLRRCFGFISRHPHLVSSYSLIEDEEAAAGSFNSSFVMLQKQKWDRGLIFSAEKTENSNFDSESHTTSSRRQVFIGRLFIPQTFFYLTRNVLTSPGQFLSRMFVIVQNLLSGKNSFLKRIPTKALQVLPPIDRNPVPIGGRDYRMN